MWSGFPGLSRNSSSRARPEDGSSWRVTKGLVSSGGRLPTQLLRGGLSLSVSSKGPFLLIWSGYQIQNFLCLGFLVLFPLLEWGVIVWALTITVCVSVFVSVLVCVCVCMCACMHVCVCLSVCTHGYMHGCFHIVSAYACWCVCIMHFSLCVPYMHVHLCVCIRAMCMCVSVCVWMFLCVCICLLCMFVYVCMCVGLCVCALEVGCHKKRGQQQHEWWM